jgi:hypothetical protein
MRIILLIITIFILNLSLASQAQNAATSFYDFSPARQTIQGEIFPRRGFLYRGTTDAQMNLRLATQALLGDGSATIESLFFSTIKHQLMGKPFPPAVTLSGFLENKIQDLTKARGSLSASEATEESKKLVDGTFQHYLKQGTLLSQYVNYRSGQYTDWPNDAVFTTHLPPLAATYGDRILVIEERKPRSLDLNYWNFANNSTWYDHTRDIGEFLAFGYIPGSDLSGYQVRSGGSKAWHYVNYALFKNRESKSKALMIFSGKKGDGETSTCIDFEASSRSYVHCHFSPGTIIYEKPALSSEKLSIVGIVTICGDESKASCDMISKAELTKYPIEGNSAVKQKIKTEITRSLEKLKVNGKAVKLFLMEDL